MNSRNFFAELNRKNEAKFPKSFALKAKLSQSAAASCARLRLLVFA
jgi:hypothetical protein